MSLDAARAVFDKGIQQVNRSLPAQERVTSFDLYLEDDRLYYVVVPHRVDGKHKRLRFAVEQLKQSGPSTDGACLHCDLADDEGWVECDGTDEVSIQ